MLLELKHLNMTSICFFKSLSIILFVIILTMFIIMHICYFSFFVFLVFVFIILCIRRFLSFFFSICYLLSSLSTSLCIWVSTVFFPRILNLFPLIFLHNHRHIFFCIYFSLCSRCVAWKPRMSEANAAIMKGGHETKHWRSAHH